MEKELVENKLAYPCFCSEERLNELTTKNSSKDKYDGHCRDIPVEASMKRIIANEPFCIRFRNEL
jgi:nondiscriminating glutamyl-tRNA synthetase